MPLKTFYLANRSTAKNSAEGIEKAADACRLTWRGAAGVIYQAQYSTNLSYGPWGNVGSPVPGTGQSVSVNDPQAGNSAPQRFYRLVLTP